MNQALFAFDSKGGVQKLYHALAHNCLGWLSQGGAGFFRYAIEVYADALATDLVTTAHEFWDEVGKSRPIPRQWEAAKFTVESEVAMANRQARASELAEKSFSLYCGGPYAARACYIIGLKELGEGKSPVLWGGRGITALGSARLSPHNFLRHQKLEILASDINRKKLPASSYLYRSRRGYQRVLELVLGDLSKIEAPISY
jgi:hypothetical protein